MIGDEILGKWKSTKIHYLKEKQPDREFKTMTIEFNEDGSGVCIAKLGFLPLKQKFDWQVGHDESHGDYVYGDVRRSTLEMTAMIRHNELVLTWGESSEDPEWIYYCVRA